ncbi:Uncharacterised protein [uncultured Clostridium sp.]|nr:Uncharacterised protein [uncultured Clostridium sp.]
MDCKIDVFHTESLISMSSNISHSSDCFPWKIVVLGTGIISYNLNQFTYVYCSHAQGTFEQLIFQKSL